MTLKRLITTAGVSTGLFTSMATPVFAQPGGLLVPQQYIEQFSITSLGEFVGALLSLMFVIAGVLVFVQIVWGGLEWLVSGGDKGKTQGARDRIVAALTGLTIIALSYAMVRLIEYFFGITIIGALNDFPRPW